MKFINPETETIYAVDNENGMYLVTCEVTKKGKQKLEIFDQITADEKIDVVRERLRVFALENNCIPLFAHKINKDKALVFQGTVSTHNVFATVPEEKLTEYLTNFFELSEDNVDLAARLDEETKSIKANYKRKIDENDAEIKKLRPIINDQCETVQVEASWERDVDNGLMFLIDQDTLQAHKYREMEPHEAENNSLFDAKEDDGDTEAPDNEPSEDLPVETEEEPNRKSLN